MAAGGPAQILRESQENLLPTGVVASGAVDFVFLVDPAVPSLAVFGIEPVTRHGHRRPGRAKWLGLGIWRNASPLCIAAHLRTRDLADISLKRA